MEEHNWKLPLVDGCLDLVFILYVHFPGAICASDLLSQALFSSAPSVGLTTEFSLVTSGTSTILGTTCPFYKHYTSSPHRPFSAYGPA